MAENVLLLCTGNSCRSQMAEGLLRELAGDRFEVYSAGTDPAESVHPLAVEVMAERGIDITQQRPKHTGEFLGKMTVHHLMVVCAEADKACPRIFPGMLHRHSWPFDDPASFSGTPEATLAEFRRVRDEIEHRLQTWLDE